MLVSKEINYKDKTIAIAGFSRTGLAVAKYLALKAKSVLILDQNDKLNVPDWVKKSPVFKVYAGNDYLNYIDKANIVLVTPGMSREKIKNLPSVKSGKTKVSSEIELLFDLLDNKIIGVTGSNGKTTVVSLIDQILKAGKVTSHLGGNIGDPLLDDLLKIKKSDVVVLELSSYQLENLTKSPNISVVLNISSNHLDRHFTMKNYILAKTNIVRYQNRGDLAVLNADDLEVMKFAKLAKGKKVYFTLGRQIDDGYYLKAGNVFFYDGEEEHEICSILGFKLKGKHNLANLLACVAVAHQMGLKRAQIEKGLNGFKGLEHRIEYVMSKRGADYYNDSKATTPAASVAALNSFGKKVVLITGGADKKMEFTLMARDISRQAKKVIIMGETGKKIRTELLKQFPNFEPNIIDCIGCDLDEALKKARNVAISGDIVLFSPGAASFDLFRDYEERGQVFKKLVQKL